MDLHDIRTKFCQLSGRYDLATTGVEAFDTDNGADYYINAGMRFLDRRFFTHKSVGHIYEEIAADAFYVTFQNCISINEVWCTDDEDRWKLAKYSLKKIKESYSTVRSDIDTGAPLYYSPINVRAVDGTDFESLGEFLDYVKTDDDGTYSGIIIAPPADEAYNIEIIGRFYHTDLSNNTDENFWTNRAPDTLVKAALYQLEVAYRNTEGAKDWLAAINLEGIDLEMNVVEQDVQDSEVIEYE